MESKILVVNVISYICRPTASYNASVESFLKSEFTPLHCLNKYIQSANKSTRITTMIYLYLSLTKYHGGASSMNTIDDCVTSIRRCRSSSIDTDPYQIKTYLRPDPWQ